MLFHFLIRIAEHPPKADKSGLEMRYATFGYALLVANARKMPRLWLMQGGGAHDKSAPTVCFTSTMTKKHTPTAFPGISECSTKWPGKLVGEGKEILHCVQDDNGR